MGRIGGARGHAVRSPTRTRQRSSRPFAPAIRFWPHVFDVTTPDQFDNPTPAAATAQPPNETMTATRMHTTAQPLRSSDRGAAACAFARHPDGTRASSRRASAGSDDPTGTLTDRPTAPQPNRLRRRDRAPSPHTHAVDRPRAACRPPAPPGCASARAKDRSQCRRTKCLSTPPTPRRHASSS